jgi:hypothetical protein
MTVAFVGPCIIIYFYSKTNQIHNIKILFYFGTTLYMFRTVFTSIIRSPRLNIQHQVYVIQVLCLLASKQPQNLYDKYLMSRGITLPFLDHSTRRGGWSTSRSGRSLPPEKTRYPLYRRLGGPQGRSGQVRKI